MKAAHFAATGRYGRRGLPARPYGEAGKAGFLLHSPRQKGESGD